MKDPSIAVRTAFYNRIVALGYQVFDRVPKIQAYPFVWLTNQYHLPNNTQGEDGCTAFITAVIVTGYNVDEGGFKEADTISNAISESIITRPITLSVTGYQCPVIVMDAVEPVEERTDTNILYIKSLRFKLFLFNN